MIDSLLFFSFELISIILNPKILRESIESELFNLLLIKILSIWIEQIEDNLRKILQYSFDKIQL